MRKAVARKDVVLRLRWIQEEGQCDCHICETAGEGAAEIELLRRALWLAVGEMSSSGEYSYLHPEELLKKFMEEAAR